jgi:hypothetical protein
MDLSRLIATRAHTPAPPSIPRFGPRGLLLLAGLALLALAVGSPRAAFAHARSVSYSSWEIDELGAEITLRLKLLELSRLGPEALPPGSIPGLHAPGAADLPARAFPRELILFANGAPCEAPPLAERRPDEPGWIRYQWRVRCPENAGALVIQSRVLLAAAPSHMHFARVRFAGLSSPVREQVLTEASPEFVVRSIQGSATNSAIGSRFLDYLELGVEHILTGWDHLAFVFGLLLLASRFGEVARLVTGFTLAHSLTLALAVLDWVHPRTTAVEAVIAFSVALVAIEKGWLLSGRDRSIPRAVLAGLTVLGLSALLGWASLPLLSVLGLLVFTACYFALVSRSDSGWLRICLTFAFGLVHGFGFAGILVEMSLPSDRLVPALLGFNLGVEVGQIGVVLILWPLLASARRTVSLEQTRWASEISAAALCGLGLYWLVERAFSF